MTSRANCSDAERRRQETLDYLRKRGEVPWDSDNIYHGRMKQFLSACVPTLVWSGRDQQPVVREQLEQTKHSRYFLTKHQQMSGVEVSVHDKSKTCHMSGAEFRDQREVLHEKTMFVAKLVRESRHTTVYTGAGLSTTAGVQQAARGGRRPGQHRRSHTTNAKPNYSNVAVAELLEAGFIQDWVTTNYDGLAQKSGCLQARSDLLERAEALGRETDLVVVLGSSLAPSPGTFLPHQVAARGLRGDCLGLVIVGLQQTPLDPAAVVRLFCDTDTFLALLTSTLRVAVSFDLDMRRHIVHRSTVPYSAAGEPVRAGEAGTVLDLSPGQEVVTRDGRAGRVLRYCSTQSAWQLDIQGSSLLLGWWWMSQAIAGRLKRLPITNKHSTATGKCH